MVRKKRILMVDDDVPILTLMSSLLTSAMGTTEIDVTTTPYPRYALDLLKEDGPFDLVITDYLMKGMNGGDILVAVRQGHVAGERGTPPDTPVLCLTSGEPAEQFSAHMWKPFPVEEFLAVVRRLLGIGPA